MANRGGSYYGKQNYRFLSGGAYLQTEVSHDSALELDESDLYYDTPGPGMTRSDSPEFRTSRVAKKPSSVKRGDSGVGAVRNLCSLPVNVPDWSKILKEEYRERRTREFDDVEDDFTEGGDDWLEGGVRVPPHEFLAKQMARTRISSFSVHEGIGRKLKGRDLRRVRNAIFEKTGFQD